MLKLYCIAAFSDGKPDSIPAVAKAGLS